MDRQMKKLLVLIISILFSMLNIHFVFAATEYKSMEEFLEKYPAMPYGEILDKAEIA